MMTKIKKSLIYFFFLFFIGLGLVSCGKKKSETDKVIIESFEYEINENEVDSLNLSYNLKFVVGLSFEKKKEINDFIVKIEGKKEFHITMDYCNTEAVELSNSNEPYALLNYSIPSDVNQMEVKANLKITTTDLIDNINRFLKIYIIDNENYEILDRSNKIEDGCFKMMYSSNSNFYYEYNEFSESYKIVSVIKKAEIIEIPSEYNNHPVKEIAPEAFDALTETKELILPNTLISIPMGLLAGMQKLKKISFPSIIPHIGHLFGSSKYTDNSKYVPSSLKEVIVTGEESVKSNAFFMCGSLTSVTISNSVTSIGQDAFYGCSRLTNVYYDGTIDDWCHISFSSATSNPMSHARHFYLRNSNNEWEEVTSIEIPNTITEIGAYQYYGFSNVLSIVIPNSITSIGTSTFYNCSGLTNVYYDGTIEDWCKLNCSIFSTSSYSNHFYVRNSNNEWEEVTSIEIPNTITEIGAYLFSGFNNVTSITIPNSVTSIGDSAFSGCSNLTSITIPSSVTSIGNSAFSDCKSPINLYFYGTIQNWCKINFANEYSNPLHYASHFYLKNSKNEWEEITNLEIPNTIREINKYQFSGFSNFISFTMPNSVTSIKYDAFSKCSNLTNFYYNGTIEDWCKINFVNEYSNPLHCASHFYLKNSKNEWEEITNLEIPNTITKIVAYQFCGLNNVTAITIPESITSIGGSAFKNCRSLTNITIPNSVTSIEDFAFSNCTSLKSVNLPNSVTSIGWGAFSGCSNLTKISLPSRIKWIADNTFSGCSSLTSIRIPDNVTSIGSYAFKDCSSLTNIDEFSSYIVTRIGWGAFSGCSSLTSVEIRDSVTSIEGSAFKGCSSLTSVTIGNSVKSIGREAFLGCYSLVELYNLSSLKIIKGDTSNGYVGYYAEVIHTSLEEDSNLITKDDFVFLKNKENKYYLVKYNGTETDIVLPKDIEGKSYEIYKYAFSGCREITSITIPNSVTSIGESAFYTCSSLTSITIGNSVTSIGSYAFFGCRKLVEVYNLSSLNITIGSTSNGYVGYYAKVIHKSLEEESNLITKDDYVFVKDKENKYYLVGYNGTAIELVLPNDIEGNTYEINDSAFSNCSSLTSITIPNSVKGIVYAALENCKNLKEVYYKGTSTEWSNITIGSENTFLTSATIYYYSETKPTEEGNYWHYVDGIATKW